MSTDTAPSPAAAAQLLPAQAGPETTPVLTRSQRRYEARRLALPVAVVPSFWGRLLCVIVLRLLGAVSHVLLARRVAPGSNRLPAGPVVLTANHRSVLDGPLLALEAYRAGRQVRLMGTAGVFTAPVVGRLFLAMGMIPVKRRTASARDALAGARLLLSEGEVVGLFPEGRICENEGGALGELRSGAARLALETRTPVVCVGMWDTATSIAPASWVPVRWWRAPVTHFVSEPVDLAARVGLGEGEPTREQVEAACQIITEVLGDAQARAAAASS